MYGCTQKAEPVLRCCILQNHPYLTKCKPFLEPYCSQSPLLADILYALVRVKPSRYGRASCPRGIYR